MDKMMRVRSIPLGVRGEETAALLEYIGADDYRYSEAWYQERRVFSMTFPRLKRRGPIEA